MATTKFLTATVENGKSTSVDFGSKVINASVAVQGFTISYGGDDHHVKSIYTKASIGGFSGSNVSVSATCYMEDDSSNKGQGSLDILIMAECDS